MGDPAWTGLPVGRRRARPTGRAARPPRPPATGIGSSVARRARRRPRHAVDLGARRQPGRRGTGPPATVSPGRGCCWQLRRPLDAAAALPNSRRAGGGDASATFEVGRDEAAWLAVNRRAFAHHPEQGRWDAATWSTARPSRGSTRPGSSSPSGAASWSASTGRRSPGPTAAGPIGEVYVVGRRSGTPPVSAWVGHSRSWVCTTCASRARVGDALRRRRQHGRRPAVPVSRFRPLRLRRRLPPLKPQLTPRRR